MPRAGPSLPRRARSSPIRTLEMLKQPISIWEHLRILTEHGFAEDAILLYEITNQSTCSSRWVVPRNRVDAQTYKGICEFYDKTKRFAQAGAILRSIIRTFNVNVSFSTDSMREPESPDEYAELEHQDNVWFSYFCILQKTNKFPEAFAALSNVSGPYLALKEQEMPRLLRQLRREDKSEVVPPEPWSADLPDENSARICPSSIGPVMSLLKKDKADDFLLLRYVSQFIGTERRDLFHWLKSAEAIGKHNTYLAIAHLKKMSHQNGRVLYEMARLNYQINKKDEARRLLSTAHYRDPLWVDGMDLLAFILIGEYFRDFEANEALLVELATTLTNEWPHRIETAIVNGFVSHQNDIDMAWSFANRAMECAVAGTEQYVYAVHLKAYCMRAEASRCKDTDSLKWNQDARKFLEESVAEMPNSADLGLLYVDTILQEEGGHRDAKIFATKFLHENQNTVNAKLLKVHVLVNGISRNPDASQPKEMYHLLREVISEHPHILSAYCYLITEYSRLKDDASCKEVFEKLCEARQLMTPAKTHKFHMLKADYSLKTRVVIPAYEHLMAAMATGAVVDANLMTRYEAEFASNEALTHDYKHLAFLDPILPERTSSSSNNDRNTVSPALQEVVNDHENEQDSESEAEDEAEDDTDNDEMNYPLTPSPSIY